MLNHFSGKWLAGLALAVAVLAAVPVAQAEEIRIAAGLLPFNKVLKPLKEPFERATGITLTIKDAGRGPLLQVLLKEPVDAVADSLPMEELFQEFRAQGGKVKKEGIRSAIIAKVPVSVIVTRENTVVTLLKDQLKEIFTGKMKNWQEVGGPNEAIRIIRPWGYPIRSTFRYQIMDGEKYADGMISASGWEGTPKAVAETPGSIAMIPAFLVNPSVKVVLSPEIVQVDTILTKGEPSPAVQKFIEFARGEGQQYLKIGQ